MKNADHGSARGLQEKPAGQVGVDLRMCQDCKHTIFSKGDFTSEIAHKPPDVRAYENLRQMERGIRIMLPRFQRLLAALQCVNCFPTSFFH